MMESSEFKTRDDLRAKRKNIKTFDDLVEFLRDVKDNYNIGYGDAPRAIAQAALGVAWFLSDDFGITGFQAGCVTWDFISDWTHTGNKTGMKLVNYDDMLYPQYSDKFEKTLTPNIWECMMKEAKKMLEENPDAHPDVIKHWKSIADGNPPFGYTVAEG